MDFENEIDMMNANLTPTERVSLGAFIMWPLLFALAVGILCGGCKAFYENAGVHVRTGSLVAPIEVSEPTQSINVRALYSMDGIDMYAAKNCNVTMVYSNIYTNAYFGLVETRGIQTSNVKIEPTADGGAEGTNAVFSATE